MVLRWSDDLPEVDKEGDIDILIDDEHAEVLGSWLTRSPWQGRVRCDVFSVTEVLASTTTAFPIIRPL